MNEKKRTIDKMKELREVPAEVKERLKKYTAIKKSIKKALEGEELTILEIAEKTGLQPDEVTYHLMTMRKFGEVEFVDDDDVDDYYSYRIKE
jgi:DNA-binding transcriptional ArsR family regulator